jgi:peptidoglycan/LPS O-acetylase OafA/YrhL
MPGFLLPASGCQPAYFRGTDMPVRQCHTDSTVLSESRNLWSRRSRRLTAPAELETLSTTRSTEPRRIWSLRRITSGSSWIPEIDGLRFIAIALVVLFHLAGEVGSKSRVPLIGQAWYSGLFTFLGRGDIGVRIFFVISGFILGRPFARHHLLGHAKPSLRSYYLRRITRLEPPYLINIAACTVAIAIYGHVPLRTLLLPFAASAVYLHGFFFRSSNVINPVAWTLEMEVQFYLLVPLLATIFLVRRAWLRRVLLGSASILLPTWIMFFISGTIGNSPYFWNTILWCLQYFLAGMLLSDFYVTDMIEWPASWRWDVVSGGAWCILLLTSHRFLYIVEPLLIALAFVGAFRGQLLRRLLSVEWLAVLGGMCYSIYLWHFFIIALVFKASRRIVVSHDLLVNFLVQSVLILPCILAYCVLYFMLIERPCMDPAWPQKAWAALSGHRERSEIAGAARTEPR